MSLDPKFLEFVNGVWFILGICVLAVFLHYIWINRARGYWSLMGAIAIATYWLGSMPARGWAWYWWHLINSGEPAAWMTEYPVIGIGGIIAAVGALCMIRVFSPAEFGNWPWIGAALLAGVFGIAVVF